MLAQAMCESTSVNTLLMGRHMHPCTVCTGRLGSNLVVYSVTLTSERGLSTNMDSLTAEKQGLSMIAALLTKHFIDQ